MTSVYLKRSDETVNRIIKATFPGFTGTKVEAIVTDSVTMYGTMWDDGNRRTYQLLRLADMATIPVPQECFGERSAAHHTPFSIPDGVVVVVLNESGITKDGIEIHSPAANISPLLESNVTISEDEKIVLMATVGLKSSYAGIKDYRFSEAKQRTGITRDRWDAAKASLIDRKLLNKAGAITIDGRNVIGNERLF